MTDVNLLIGLLFGVFAGFASSLFIQSFFRTIDRREQGKPYRLDLAMWVFSGALLVILVSFIGYVIVKI